MIKKVCCIVMIIIFCFTLTACWSKEEPRDLAVILSVVYDMDEEENYPLLVEILDTQTSDSEGTTQPPATKLIQLKSVTVPEAIRDTRITVDKRMYGAHNKVRFFTERFAKKGLKDITDFFLRDHLTDERPYMIIVKTENPLELYKADMGLADSLGGYVDDIAKARDATTEYSIFVDTLEFIKAYYSEGKQPVMGVVEVVPNETFLDEEGGEQQNGKNILTFDGLAVFKEDKLVGYLNKIDTRAFYIVTGKIGVAYISVPVEGEYIAGNCLKTNTDIQTSFSKGIVNIDIEIDKEIMLSQNDSRYDVTDKDEVKVIEKAISDYFEDEIKASIEMVQKEFKSDIYGFGEQFHIQNPQIWKAIKANWDDDYFATAEISVKINTRVHFDGETREKFGEEVEGDE